MLQVHVELLQVPGTADTSGGSATVLVTEF